MTPRSDLYIGEVALATGISIETLRSWEGDGQMPFPVRRSTLGWRIYGPDEIERIKQFAAERAASRKRQPTT